MTDEPTPATPATPKAALGWMAALAAVVVLTAVIVVAQDDTEPVGVTDVSAAPVDLTSTVLYEVEGSTDYAAVTMETPDGSEQINPDVPMVRTGSGERGLEMEFSAGAFVYLSAQNKRAYGTVTCRITVDGIRRVRDRHLRGLCLTPALHHSPPLTTTRTPSSEETADAQSSAPGALRRENIGGRYLESVVEPSGLDQIQ
jgi:hypothetical protein